MIDRAAITAAAARIGPYVRRTPVLRITAADLGLAAQRSMQVALKLELLQHAGSFKPRGAFNRMLNTDIPAAGVIAASGGNHGAAVAYAARCLDVAAEIFVPAATPEAKLSRIAGYGARVIRTGETYADALAACRQRQTVTGALDIHAYDHADVLAGQGTAAREFEQDSPDLTHILVATGGGGLIGGAAAWYAGSATVIGVEPESCPTLHDALRAGLPVDAPVGGIAADSLGARVPDRPAFRQPIPAGVRRGDPGGAPPVVGAVSVDRRTRRRHRDGGPALRPFLSAAERVGRHPGLRRQHRSGDRRRPKPMIEFIGQPEAGGAGPFSLATRAGGLIFVSGRSAPHDPARGVHRGDTAQAQVRQALEAVAAILHDSGSSLDRVVQITMLITDPADYAACNEEYVKHFPAGLPARHTARFGVPTEAKVGFACIALTGD
jgi:threonine dehydratase